MGDLGDVQGEDSPAVKRLVEVDEASSLRLAPEVRHLQVMEVDEILHHVLHRFRTRVHRVDLELGIPHALRRDLVQRAVVGHAVGGQEVGIADLVVRGRDESADVVGFGKAGMIVGDPLRSVIARPVEDLLPFRRDQPHAVPTRDIDDERIRLGNDVAAQLIEQRTAQWPGERFRRRIHDPTLHRNHAPPSALPGH